MLVGVLVSVLLGVLVGVEVSVFVAVAWPNGVSVAVFVGGLVVCLAAAELLSRGLTRLGLRAGLAEGLVGLLAATYPGVWGVTQLGTGALSDRVGRKRMIVAGMWIQAMGILLVILGSGFGIWLLAMSPLPTSRSPSLIPLRKGGGAAGTAGTMGGAA